VDEDLTECVVVDCDRWCGIESLQLKMFDRVVRDLVGLYQKPEELVECGSVLCGGTWRPASRVGAIHWVPRSCTEVSGNAPIGDGGERHLRHRDEFAQAFLVLVQGIREQAVPARGHMTTHEASLRWHGCVEGAVRWGTVVDLLVTPRRVYATNGPTMFVFDRETGQRVA